MTNYRHVFPSLLILILVSLTNGMAQIPALSECTLARQQFTQLNDRLLLSRDRRTENNPAAMKAGTQDLEGYITRILLSRLSDSGDPGVIRNYLDCMQSREETLPPEWATNTPQVFIDKTPGSWIAVSAMLILRGGEAIAYTRPVLQCFFGTNRKWTLVGGSGEEFDTHTFFIHPLKSPNPQERWFLLSGTAIGDTGGRLHLEVVSCSASKYRKVWDRDGFVWGKVDVQPTAVVLRYEKRADPDKPLPADQWVGPGSILYEKGKDDPIEFSETLRVTRRGLEQ